MGVCGCVIPNPNCLCHSTPNYLVTMPKSVLDQIGKEHTEEIERLREENQSLRKRIDLNMLEIREGQLRGSLAELIHLRQQYADLLTEMERIADVSERWEDSLVSQINEIARAALAKATGGE